MSLNRELRVVLGIGDTKFTNTLPSVLAVKCRTAPGMDDYTLITCREMSTHREAFSSGVIIKCIPETPRSWNLHFFLKPPG